MSVWATSQICREAEREREQRDANLAREKEPEHQQNLKAWERNGLDGAGHDLIQPDRHESRLPTPGTACHAALFALSDIAGFASAHTIRKTLHGTYGAEAVSAALRGLHERGLVDRTEGFGVKGHLAWHYRLSPRAKNLVTHSHVHAA